MRRHFLTALALVTIGVFTACGSSSGGLDGRGQGGAGGSAAGGATAGASGSTGTGGGTGGAGGKGGGSGGSGGAGGNAGATGIGGSGAGGTSAAACGARSCTSGEVCVRPGCGGGIQVCDPFPDGGQCPSGWTETLCFATPNRMGCVPPPCTPPAPFCAPLPASCSGAPSCTCLPQNVCGQNGGQCGFIQNGAVVCGFA